MLSQPYLRTGQQGRSPGHAVVWQGRNPRDTPRPRQQSPQTLSLRASGSRRGFGALLPGRAPPSPLLTHRGLRIPSGKPWPRRSLYLRAGCSESCVQTLLKQLLLSLNTDRSCPRARHVPGLADPGRHIRGVTLHCLPLAFRRSRFCPCTLPIGYWRAFAQSDLAIVNFR